MSGEDPACSLPVSAAVNMHQHERAPLIFPHNSTGFVYVCALHNLIDVTSINTMKLKIRFTFFFSVSLKTTLEDTHLIWLIMHRQRTVDLSLIIDLERAL